MAMLKRGANRNGKILKPVAEVTEEDVAALLADLIGGEPDAEGEGGGRRGVRGFGCAGEAG